MFFCSLHEQIYRLGIFGGQRYKINRKFQNINFKAQIITKNSDIHQQHITHILHAIGNSIAIQELSNEGGVEQGFRH